jgi:hypothetical protein
VRQAVDFRSQVLSPREAVVKHVQLRCAANRRLQISTEPEDDAEDKALSSDQNTALLGQAELPARSLLIMLFSRYPDPEYEYQ